MYGTGYQCRVCGYEPDWNELHRGQCPECAEDHRLLRECHRVRHIRKLPLRVLGGHIVVDDNGRRVMHLDGGRVVASSGDRMADEEINLVVWGGGIEQAADVLTKAIAREVCEGES